MPERRLHLCRETFEPHLLAELGRALPDSAHRQLGPGLLESELSDADAARTPALAFAGQALPAAEPLSAASVNAWARTAGDQLIARLREHQGPWRLHALAPPGGPGGRAKLVEAALLGHLKQKQRRLLRTRVEGGGPFAPGEALAQLLLHTPEAGWLSVALPDDLRRLRRVLSPLPGGVAHVARDPRPPSRAYQKLVEAELRLGRPIGRGETVVDLGASPGGWSYVALERGARVYAVDRSPLRDDLMRNPLLHFHQGDAFAWEPPAPVDWLICDLIAFPERTLELLDRWLARGWCKRFCVTMKFRGTEDYARVDELKALLARRAGDFLVRQLDANKNEVTAMGEARSEPRAILFDMDGVLVKSWEVWYRVVAEAGVRFRGREISREEFAPTFGQGTAADIPAFGLNCTQAELDRFYADNFMRHAEAMWVNPEAAPLLELLAKRGYRLAVVTNTVTSLTRDILTHAKLLNHFAFVACADQVGKAKPAPDIVLHACARLGVRPGESWMIGDSKYDRGSAQSAGARFIGLGLEGDDRIDHLRELGALLPK